MPSPSKLSTSKLCPMSPLLRENSPLLLLQSTKRIQTRMTTRSMRQVWRKSTPHCKRGGYKMFHKLISIRLISRSRPTRMESHNSRQLRLLLLKRRKLQLWRLQLHQECWAVVFSITPQLSTWQRIPILLGATHLRSCIVHFHPPRRCSIPQHLLCLLQHISLQLRKQALLLSVMPQYHNQWLRNARELKLEEIWIRLRLVAHLVLLLL